MGECGYGRGPNSEDVKRSKNLDNPNISSTMCHLKYLEYNCIIERTVL
jgi:hypothetical protein